MKYKVVKTINEHNMLKENDKVLVALSGGADSVCLLNILIDLKEKYSLSIYAAHLNHCLRGQESNRDEDFVKKLCKSKGIKLFVKKIDINSLAKKEKTSIELCGRNERYNFFKEIAEEKKCKIATAHTASDNVETLLFNISRGSSLKGISGIPYTRSNIIRPILEMTRNEVEEYCLKNNLKYVTDSTNLTDKYTRNNIRHNVVPVLKEINTNLEEAVLRLNTQVRQVDDFLNSYSKEALKSNKVYGGYNSKALSNLHKAAITNCIRILLDKNNIKSYTAKHIELCYKIIKDKGSVELPGGFVAVSSQNLFRILDNNKKLETFKEISIIKIIEDNKKIKYNNKTYEFCLKTFKNSKETEKKEKEPFKNIITSYIMDSTVLRTRKSGDVFMFPKSSGSKLLNKVLIDKKIPKEKRDSLLLIANNNKILWMEKLGTSAFGIKKTENEKNEEVIKIKILNNSI